MSRPQDSHHGEHGVVFIQAIMLVVAVALLAVSAMQRGSTLARDNVRERAQLRALHAAEGGLAKARHALKTDPEFAGADLRIGRCTVVVTVKRQSDAQWAITVRATCPTRGRESVTVGLSEGYGTRRWYRTLR